MRIISIIVAIVVAFSLYFLIVDRNSLINFISKFQNEEKCPESHLIIKYGGSRLSGNDVNPINSHPTKPYYSHYFYCWQLRPGSSPHSKQLHRQGMAF